MNAAGEAATWLALIAAAWTTGFCASRWGRDGDSVSAPLWSVFGAAAPLAFAWASLTGAALRGDPLLAVVSERVAVDAAPLYRAAAVLTSAPGLLLTLAFLLSVLMLAAATGRTGATTSPVRRIAVYSAAIVLAVATMIGRWPPFARGGASGAAELPLALLHPGPALSGLLAVAALAMAVHGIAWILTTGRGPDAPVRDHARRAFAIGLLCATLGLAADQWTRTQLAPAAAGDRNTAGLLLWAFLAVLSHGRARRVLGAAGEGVLPRASRRLPALLSHAGAACIVAAFGAHVAASRASVSLAPGRAAEIPDVFGRTWSLVNQGVSRFDDRGRDVAAVAIEVRGPSGTRLMTTQLAAYHTRAGEATTGSIATRGVAVGPLQTLLVTLESAASDDSAAVRIAFIPLALLWIPGVLLIVAGGAIIAAGSPAGSRGAPTGMGTPLEPAGGGAGVSSPADEAAAEDLVRRWREASVECPVCGRRPEPDSRFCSSCGRALLPCAVCGAVTAEPAARHCARCGAALAWPAGRPLVTARSTPDGAEPDAAE